MRFCLFPRKSSWSCYCEKLFWPVLYLRFVSPWMEMGWDEIPEILSNVYIAKTKWHIMFNSLRSEDRDSFVAFHNRITAMDRNCSEKKRGQTHKCVPKENRQKRLSIFNTKTNLCLIVRWPYENFFFVLFSLFFYAILARVWHDFKLIEFWY